MNIFKQVKMAILNFEKYPDLLKTKLSKVIIYALFFISITNIIYIFAPILNMYVYSGGYNSIINNYVPDFKVEDSQVVLNEVYKKNINNLNLTLIFNTDKSEDNQKITIEDLKNSKSLVLKITNNKALFSFSQFSINLSPFIDMFNIKSKADIFYSFNVFKLYFSYYVFIIYKFNLLFL